MGARDNEIVGSVEIPGSKLGWRICVTKKSATESPSQGLFSFFAMVAPFLILVMALAVAANQ